MILTSLRGSLFGNLRKCAAERYFAEAGEAGEDAAHEGLQAGRFGRWPETKTICS